MRGFIKHILLVLVLAALLAELLLRVGGLAAHVPPMTSLHGDRMYSPGAEAAFVAGGMGEIRGRYCINAQGWNSLADFSSTDSTCLRVALIGDSFIESMQGDVSETAGRILEGFLPGCQVHEYGMAGANIADHVLVWEQWVRGRYDQVFIWISMDDICAVEASYMGKGDAYRDPGPLKRLYHRSALLRYLGLNHKLGRRAAAWFGSIRAKSNKTNTTCIAENMNRSALDLVAPHVTFLYEEERLPASFTREYPCLQVRHTRLPKDFGFDGHWNRNGRRNVAQTLKDYLEDN